MEGLCKQMNKMSVDKTNVIVDIDSLVDMFSNVNLELTPEEEFIKLMSFIEARPANTRETYTICINSIERYERYLKYINMNDIVYLKSNIEAFLNYDYGNIDTEYIEYKYNLMQKIDNDILQLII